MNLLHRWHFVSIKTFSILRLFLDEVNNVFCWLKKFRFIRLIMRSDCRSQAKNIQENIVSWNLLEIYFKISETFFRQKHLWKLLRIKDVLTSAMGSKKKFSWRRLVSTPCCPQWCCRLCLWSGFVRWGSGFPVCRQCRPSSPCHRDTPSSCSQLCGFPSGLCWNGSPWCRPWEKHSNPVSFIRSR